MISGDASRHVLNVVSSKDFRSSHVPLGGTGYIKYTSPSGKPKEEPLLDLPWHCLSPDCFGAGGSCCRPVLAKVPNCCHSAFQMCIRVKKFSVQKSANSCSEASPDLFHFPPWLLRKPE